MVRKEAERLSPLYLVSSWRFTDLSYRIALNCKVSALLSFFFFQTEIFTMALSRFTPVVLSIETATLNNREPALLVSFSAVICSKILSGQVFRKRKLFRVCLSTTILLSVSIAATSESTFIKGTLAGLAALLTNGSAFFHFIFVKLTMRKTPAAAQVMYKNFFNLCFLQAR